ncbi:MAG: hypothetical protein Q8M08_03145 [Bacteroidales bacterium]|nr:hypothetical protein [Bacteroidales bacterium]
MAEYGEWIHKGATISDVTAKKEYGVSRNFIIEGIEAGKLEYREGSVWGNPYLRLLRKQLEEYISDRLGKNYLAMVKNEAEFKMVKKEISELKKKLMVLEVRKAQLEGFLKKL